MSNLKEKIVVVAGATRGCGRGIAVELGAAGATVYCTGRSTRGNPSDLNRPETIEETAELVTKAGGTGIAVRVDHTQEAQVKALFEQVKAEQGRLDILVNDVWGGDGLIEWGKPFWEMDMALGWRLLERSVYSHLLTSRYAVPLMLEQNSGLIVEVTDGDTLNYRGNFFYDLVKTTVIRLAHNMAEEFKGQRINVLGQPNPVRANITALALTPGFLRSEAMLEHFGVSEANWRDAIAQDPYYAESETPHYIGRAVVALATDPKVHEKAGQALATWHLSREYGFTDIDGRAPHWQEFYEGKKAAEA
ncbi:SDR family oxidoreductase [Meiothermus ruber]|jgi:NAD(P)-dependent dehydrogenase (short-subunit alcohol dehydrogenase family)|uniref:Short-chain dehydrogenase/reductase SDR n=1 Tax=Meiothermus ruber (strain ATCC 35948 / DSM 1279 / VKM B-1258 / 21) TaxID=504728 RepID=D3PM03_MEIRD|nr:SDR family oxidoreductase [Meiothermus ruber]ADD27114.1 short-chain dehydrogenase/reductase SDR [Meiothermus ruber DSM 1279]AGK03568.1 short-chain dehydrogenase/reductase SDR [Meiothermus ruber DSM 1279]MCL6530164.1 SDR family NAD(P)-dependent oxidoreductase [Meiothermus ruber]GAO74036.1 short-chain dehydrogenase/reductase SDR [Meiothermus ruber H328]